MIDKVIFDTLVAELKTGKSNCIILKGNETLRFRLPGVKTLMTLLKEDPGFLKDSFVFDKIVGKGAAALLILGKVKGIYAGIISEKAIALLQNNNINLSYGEKVPFIENKTKTGLCPIEALSLESDNPQVIHEKITAFLSTMNFIKTI